jgi:hypothetical protein
MARAVLTTPGWGNTPPMSVDYATFGLAPAVRAGGLLAGGAYQAHRDFLDFVIDGRPLLLRLHDLDAVSPLASDVPPAIFAAQIRGLLLETEAPLSGGRYVVYNCPECESLECGAVTAVIEADDGDIVWRDFAWQTTATADLERDGYHGLGPFRFRAAEYRTQLERLRAPERRRVLLIGARVAVLARLAAALRRIGIGAEIAADTAFVPPEELRTYGAVVFGRTVGERERAAVREAFSAAGGDVRFVDGLAPVVPLLVAQIEHALDRSPLEQRRLTGLLAAEGEASVEVTAVCRVRLTAYRIDRLHRVHAREVFDAELEPGSHRIPLDARATKGESFLVARTTGSVLTAVGGR